MGNEVQFGKKRFVGQVASQFSQKYVVQRILGEGAYARVFQVQNRTTGQIYACKEFQKNKTTDLEALNSEIDIMIDMDHPNIIRIYEVYEDDNFIRIIMEKCNGGELFDTIINRVDEGKMFNEKEAAHIFKQIIGAVNYSHANHICHRDLKPENVLLVDGDDLEVKVIDFGMGKHFDKKGKMNERVGTSYYIAPEVLKGKYDEKCDIWSCGVILYILLSGFPPFNGDDDDEIMENVRKMSYDFPDSEWKYISKDAKDLIKSMLSPPEKRPNAQQVMDNPWVKNNAPNSKDSLKSFKVEKLKKYASTNKMKKAVLTYRASRSSNKEKAKMDKVFKAMDTNGDGMLSLEEIKAGIAQISKESPGLKMSEVEAVFASIDTDGSGVIDYNEFLAATLTNSIENDEKALRDAFNMFDIDGSGKISKEEVATIFKSTPDAEYIKKIFKKYDKNGDGEIDFDEFMIMMKDN
ncbi:MAG: protein kinase [archaeon]|nr:protein kinase [archaeon]